MIMKYTVEEKLEIGKEIYTGNIKIHEAAVKYEIGTTTARECMRLYRDANNLPSRNETKNPKVFVNADRLDYSDLESLSKEQLIDEIIKARVEAERAKKGYTVKGGGAAKEFISLKNQNSK